MVDKRNLSIRQPSKKLDHKKAGPFPIIKVTSKWAFWIQLLDGSQAHPTLFIKSLEPYRTSQQPIWQQRPPSLEPIDEKYRMSKYISTLLGQTQERNNWFPQPYVDNTLLLHCSIRLAIPVNWSPCAPRQDHCLCRYIGSPCCYCWGQISYRGLGISWCFTLPIPSNKKRKSSKGK